LNHSNQGLFGGDASHRKKTGAGTIFFRRWRGYFSPEKRLLIGSSYRLKEECEKGDSFKVRKRIPLYYEGKGGGLGERGLPFFLSGGKELQSRKNVFADVVGEATASPAPTEGSENEFLGDPVGERRGKNPSKEIPKTVL